MKSFDAELHPDKTPASVEKCSSFNVAEETAPWLPTGGSMFSKRLVRAHAFGRIGVLGNPSDLYGGKTLAACFDRCAELEIGPAEQLIIESHAAVESNLDYNGNHDLIKATIKVLWERHNLPSPQIHIRYRTSIPTAAGLAGSAAIVIAMLRAANRLHKIGMNSNEIAETATHVENTELGITAGFQDRYAIAHGGLNFFDFSGKEYMRLEDPPARVEPLSAVEVPWFIALTLKPAAVISSDIHRDLRARFLNGEAWIKSEMDQLARLAEQGKHAMIRRDWRRLGELMNAHTEIRESFHPHLPVDLQAIRKAQSLGALGAKLAGSGGAILVLADEPCVLRRIGREFNCFTPRIVA